MLITFLRHAQSEANIFKNLYSRDSRLSQFGIKQSEKLTGHFDIVFCSPMRRTRQTLEHSKISYDELVIVSEARECRWAVSDLLEDDKEPDDFLESNEQIAARCRRFYQKLRAANPRGDKKILVVSHHNFIFDFTDRYCRRRLAMDNASMEEAEVELQPSKDKCH